MQIIIYNVCVLYVSHPGNMHIHDAIHVVCQTAKNQGQKSENQKSTLEKSRTEIEQSETQIRYSKSEIE